MAESPTILPGENGAESPPTPLFSSQTPPEVGERMVVVGQMLATSGEALLGSLKSPVRTSSDLIKAAGVNKDIASRFMSALAKRDPMAVAYYMPGVESLRRISRGAKARAGAPAAPVIKTFDQAISAFERFLQDELGGRHALDAVASAWLPEARERFEATSRQMHFRATANLRGIECRVITNASLICPGADADRYDAVQISGLVGLQRLRPTVPLKLATFEHRDDTAGRPTMTIDGRPIPADGSMEEYLPQFSTRDASCVRVLSAGSCSFYQFVDQSLGVGRSNDLIFGQYVQGLFRRWARQPGDIAANMESVEIPAQRLVLDVLVHRDAWPGIEPELMIYNTCTRGTALPYDASRDSDRVDLLDSIRPLGDGVDCCRVTEAPRYLDLLRWSCAQRGWDPGAFRVYRCDTRHPVVGMQYTAAFRLRERPLPA
ncbi:MAG: hypothetical protein QM783_02895 [Phycisphaerales bacterium]